MTGKAFGVQSPTQGETAVSWQTWSDGSSNVPTIDGDADWGKLKLDLSGEEGRSAVYDLGSEATRKFTLTENRYGTGEEDATLQYRTDTSSFAQDDASPAWTTYSAPFSVNCRYVQIREITQSIVTYYVDATGGDDGNDGLSIDQAWQTITKVNATNFNPGDHILFKRGETFSGKLLPTDSGTDDQSIVYGAYGSGNRPVIDGSSDKAFNILNSAAHHLRVEHIDFSGSINTSQHVVKCDTHDVYFYDCIFRDGVGGTAGNGVGFHAYYAGSGSYLYNIILDSCVAHSNSASGIAIGSTLGTEGPHDCLIKNCTAYNNGTTLYLDHGIYTRHGVTIDRCTCYNNIYGSGIKVNDEGVYNSPYTPIVSNCVSYGNHDGLTLDNVRSIIYNNLIYNNIYNAIPFTASSSDCLVYHNTIVNIVGPSGNALMKFGMSRPTGMVVKNNLFIQDDSVYNQWVLTIAVGSEPLSQVAANNTFDYNIYFHNANTAVAIGYDTANRTFADWQSYGAEANGAILNGLPDFVTRYTDLHPADAGNLKALGVAITSYGIDKDSNARADPPTPGCYEEASA